MPQDRSQFKHGQSVPPENGAEDKPESKSIASASHTASQKLGQEAFTKSKLEPLQQAKLLGEGIVSGLALNPVNGLAQLSNKSFGTNFKAIHLGAQSEVDSSIAGNVGKMIGTTATFIALALATKKFTPLGSKILGSAALSESVAFGTAGAIQGGLLTPTQKDLSGSSFFLSRGGEALLGSGSAVLGAQGSRVARLFQASAPSLGVTGSRMLSLGAEGVFNGALGAGTAHAYSYMQTGKWASNQEVANSAMLSAGIGLGASALSLRKGAGAADSAAQSALKGAPEATLGSAPDTSLGSAIFGLKSQDQIPPRSSLTPLEFAQISEHAQGLKLGKSDLYRDLNVSPDTHFVSPDPIGELTNGKFRAGEGSESGTSLQSKRPGLSMHKLSTPEAVQQELDKVFGANILAPIKDGRDFEFSKMVKTEHGDIELRGLYRKEYNDISLSFPPARVDRASMLIKLDTNGRPNQVNLVNDSNGFFSTLFDTMGAKQLASDLGSSDPKAFAEALKHIAQTNERAQAPKPSLSDPEALAATLKPIAPINERLLPPKPWLSDPNAFAKAWESIAQVTPPDQRLKPWQARNHNVPGGTQSARPEPRAVQGMSSLADLEERLRGLQAVLGTAELPTSATSDPATWKFIPEKATKLDASKLELLDPAQGRKGSTALGDRIVEIKRYINSEGEQGREYLARIAKSSDITIIGEQHTLNGPNPHRVLGAEVLGELPPGSTLAIELPSSLESVFEEFNNNRGSDLPLASQFGDMMSKQPALSLLRTINSNFPEMVNMWKSARDKGVRVVPVDVELGPSVRLTSESREATIAANLLALSDRAAGKPVVAWFGNAHGARGTEGGVPLLAKRIAESPEFASGKRKLSTVLSQLSEKEAERGPLSVLAKDVRETVGMPTVKHGKETPIGEIPVMDEATATQVETDIKVSDYDHLILYPPTPPEALANYYMQRADALMSGS